MLPQASEQAPWHALLIMHSKVETGTNCVVLQKGAYGCESKLTFFAEGQPLQVSPQGGLPLWAAQPGVLHRCAPPHIACMTMADQFLHFGVQLQCNCTISPVAKDKLTQANWLPNAQ